MCVVSMVMDHYWEKWKPYEFPHVPYQQPVVPQRVPSPEEIEEFRRLLERAREYDRKNNEPDCELAEKRKLLQDLAKKLGVDISFL